jgi:hypothetical protein
MLKPKNCRLYFLGKKKSESKNLWFWVFQKLKETADSMKEPAKDSRFFTVSLIIFTLKKKNGGHISELVYKSLFLKEFLLFVAKVVIIQSRCRKSGNHPKEDLAKSDYKL